MLKIFDRYKNLSAPIKASFWFFVCAVLQKGISVLVTPIFTRLMGTDQYGQYTLFLSWADIITVVFTMRMWSGALMQGLIRYEEDQDKFTAALQGLVTASLLVAFVVYLPFHDLFNRLVDLSTPLFMCIFLYAWTSAMFGFWSTRQRIEYRYRMLVVITLAAALAQPLLAIFLIKNAVWTPSVSRIYAMVIVGVIFYAWIFFYYLYKGRIFFHRRYWKQAVKFSLPLIPHYLSQTALSQADRIMIAQFCGMAEAGIYGLAYQLSWMMQIISGAITSSLSPWLMQKIKEQSFRQIAHVSYILVGLVALANLALVALAPEIVAIFAPAQYASGVWVVPPLALSVVLVFSYELFADFEFYYERTTMVMVASVVGAIVNVVLNFFFIPRFGFIAGGYTTLIGYMVYIIMHYFFMRKVQRDELDGVRVYNPAIFLGLFVAFIGISALLVIWYPYPMLRYGFIAVMLVGLFIKRRDLLELRDKLKNKA